ncbi:hypothetical protein SEPCBS57363_002354 [Sporothrix epigloea]|uniref:Aminoglycoside phosphotransferase domain-containing protein n=1 Tax=Sporothrix epigloea TaxID=1892477 RepID=A0ABP0DH38_9PEZI
MPVSPITLPYFRPGDLPAPLPTLAEIQENFDPELSPRRNALGSIGGFSLIRDTYAVKFGFDVSENEGYALLFAEQNLSVPTPRLYAMYREPLTDHLYLVMDLIPGVSLESVWSTLSTESKSSLTTQLREMFTSMRMLSPPRAFIGGIAGGRIPSPVFSTFKPDPDINGPFKTTEEVGRAMARASREVWLSFGQQNWESEFFSRHLPTALKDHAVKLTHGDFHMRNIMVDKVQKGTNGSAQTEEGSTWKVTGIIDWEAAGWYPAYWEYASAMARAQSEHDWPERLDTILEPYPLECSIFVALLKNMQLIF